MARVWANPPVGGTELLVLIAMADYADEDRRYAWPSVPSLARKTAMSERSVQRILRKLTADGILRVIREGGRGARSNLSTIYEVLPEGPPPDRGVTVDTGDTGGSRGVTPASPNPSREPSNASGGVGARASTLKVAGKPVVAAHWELTVRILAELNTRLGRNLGALTGAGQPSESAKRIYGRVLAWPDLDLAAHLDIIDRTLASKWWGAGAPSVGVIYGPKVFEDNMHRQPSDVRPASASQARQDAWADYLAEGEAEPGDVIEVDATEAEDKP
jgi:hypothetical protein